MRERFLRHVWNMVGYWERDERTPATRDKLSGLAFSILAAIDGSAAALPAFTLAASPHPDDEEFNRSEGENWYPRGADVPHDIAGTLHDHFHDLEPKP